MLIRHYAHSSKAPSERCYYEVLGVPKNATTVQIKTAFYAKSKQVTTFLLFFRKLRRSYAVLHNLSEERI